MNVIDRPTEYVAEQWTGTNVDTITTLCASIDAQVDVEGDALVITLAATEGDEPVTITVQPDEWVIVTSSTTVSALPPDEFAARYIETTGRTADGT